MRKANAERKAAGLPIGRPKGVPNKLTALVRGELMAVYEEIGGREGFVKWAKGHRTQFYNLLARAAPREREANSLGTGIVINVGAATELQPVIEVQRDGEGS